MTPYTFLVVLYLLDSVSNQKIVRRVLVDAWSKDEAKTAAISFTLRYDADFIVRRVTAQGWSAPHISAREEKKELEQMQEKARYYERIKEEGLPAPGTGNRVFPYGDYLLTEQ